VAILPSVKMRVVIADDSVLLREGVSRLLDEAGFEVTTVAFSQCLPTSACSRSAQLEWLKTSGGR